MNVDVDFLERCFDKQQRRRIDAIRQDRSIPFRQRASDRSIANEPSVHKQILRIARCASISRRGNKTGDAGHRRIATIHLEQILQKLIAKNLVRALAEIFCRSSPHHFPAVVDERKRDLRMGQRVVSDEICEVIRFSRFRSHELSSRWNVEKQIAHDDGCPAWMSSVFDVAHAPAVDRDARCCLCAVGTRCQLDSRNGSDRCQRFAAKTERCDGG